METDGGVGAERVFARYAPKEGARYYRSETQEGRNQVALNSFEKPLVASLPPKNPFAM